mmetsp:Transcript_37333/g.60709  ORF Transcript_37333/g.60709 Transcript_37333/m.60709 type:complete len:106 (+) Transcript_37333:622-939(+)
MHLREDLLSPKKIKTSHVYFFSADAMFSGSLDNLVYSKYVVSSLRHQALHLCGIKGSGWLLKAVWLRDTSREQHVDQNIEKLSPPHIVDIACGCFSFRIRSRDDH